jgi:hypothetical protein
MFELKTTLPTAKDLVIRVKDWDLLTTDDVIGQTTIDLENRFLSKYRATCGLPLQYNAWDRPSFVDATIADIDSRHSYRTGPNQWRDSVKPVKILQDVCKRNNLPAPEIIDDQSIKIGDSMFRLDDFGGSVAFAVARDNVDLVLEQDKQLSVHVGDDEERLALYILHKLRLCPEHVETRPLFNPLQPLIEQGRLELFVDIFPKSQGAPGPAFDVTPRKPKP